MAPTGRAKSTTLRFAKGPLSAHTRKWREEYRAGAAVYQADHAAYTAAFDRWKKNPVGDPPAKPDRPLLTQPVIDKFTVESLVRINADNPRGVVLAQDELAGLVTGLGQYKARGGDDKQTLLSLWAGAEAEVNRVRDKDGCGLPLYVAHTFVGVAGMIQPDLLALLRGDFGRSDFVNDGWADRFLLSFPDPPPLVGETWATVPEALEQRYVGVYEQLLGLKMVVETDPTGAAHGCPFYLDARAVVAWQEFTDDIAARGNTLDWADNYVGVLSKLRHYGLRLATLAHCLRAACGEVANQAVIDGESVCRAALVAYFDAHGRRCLGVGWADRPVRVAQRLLARLTRHPSRVGFNRTEAFLALKGGRDVKSSEALAPAFRLLEEYRHGIAIADDPNGRQRILFVNPAGERKAIRLGKIDRKARSPSPGTSRHCSAVGSAGNRSPGTPPSGSPGSGRNSATNLSLWGWSNPSSG